MLYLVANGPMPTTVAQAPDVTVVGIKTMLQIKPFNICKIVEWGISFDGASPVTPFKVELLDTGTVFATVTAHVDAGIPKMESVEQGVASIAGLTMGTAATGYTGSAEGSITATRMFDVQFIPPTNQYVKQFPLGREPKCIIGNSVRIRVTAGSVVNCYCYMIVEI